jgi:hypothetical protein
MPNGEDMTDCDKLTEETKGLMFSLIKRTRKEQKEHLINLCENKNKSIVHSNVCVGSYCEISSSVRKKVKCPVGTKEIGNFHTHPDQNPTAWAIKPSPGDVGSAAYHEAPFICIGVNSLIDTIVCYDVIDKEILRLGKDFKRLEKEGAKLKVLNEKALIIEDRIRKLKGIDIVKSKLLDKKCEMTRPQ